MPTFISRIFRFLLRLVFWLLAALFAVSLLVASLVVIALGLIKALLTGKRPQAVAFARVQKFSADAFWPGAAAPGRPATRKADVVDVEVREVRNDKDTF